MEMWPAGWRFLGARRLGLGYEDAERFPRCLV